MALVPWRKAPVPSRTPPSEAGQVCGAQHPNKPAVHCNLPEGHGVVEINGLPFTHYYAPEDRGQQGVLALGWFETRPR